MLTIACVCWGNKYPKKYVNILQAMVKRNLTVPHRFICFTDDPKGFKCQTKPLPKGLPGWWNKMYLFKAGLFEDKCLFLDLDVAITGSLDGLAALNGFHIISDWNVGGYNSSVMLLDPKEDVSRVWNDFKPEMIKRYYGDQDVITEMLPDAKLFADGECLSYKASCFNGVPAGAKIVVFHGRPNPHEFTSPWIRKYWRE